MLLIKTRIVQRKTRMSIAAREPLYSYYTRTRAHNKNHILKYNEQNANAKPKWLRIEFDSVIEK